MRKLLLLFGLLICGSLVPAAHGQTIICQASGGAWGPCPLNASVQLFTTTAATGTATSTAQKVYNFSFNGTLVISYAGITGSPATCTLQIKSGDSLGNLINNGSAISIAPANGTVSVQFTAAPSQQNADQIQAVYACGTYPTAGTISLEYVPALEPALDTNGRQAVRSYPDTTTTSYHAAASFAGSSTTDNSVFPGNATNTVLLTKITVTCTETTAGTVTLTLIKRSAADTSGTSVAMTKVPDDANYAAAVSAPLTYTGTGPSVGTAVGNLDVAQFGCNAAATAGPNDIYIFKPVKPIILRGTAQEVAVNMGNAAITGGTLTVTYDWQETTIP
jgi:hypothetical protein